MPIAYSQVQQFSLQPNFSIFTGRAELPVALEETVPCCRS
jgi:hypothetical protein